MSNETVAQLKALKLHGMASSWPELLAQARHAEFDPQRFMEQLIAAERAELALGTSPRTADANQISLQLE